MREQSDAILVARCLDGEKSAFSRLVLRHEARVRRVLLAVAGTRVDVEDLLQETFLQAYLALPTLRQPERFSAWLCSIGVNLARMRLRAQRPLLGWDELDAPIADPRPLPEHIASERERMQQLQAAIADLSAAERHAIVLVYREGLTQREAAGALGISLSALKVRVHRGRRHLRGLLETDIATREKRMIAVEIHDILAFVDQETAERYINAARELAEREAAPRKETIHRFINALPSTTGHRVVLLKERVGERALALWIGPYEADALLVQLHKMAPARPLTFDLTKTLLDLGDLHIEQVAVSRLHESIFFGTLFVRLGGRDAITAVDCRPSDALVLAVRMDAPIFVAPQVMEAAATLPGENGRYTVKRAEIEPLLARSLLQLD